MRLPTLRLSDTMNDAASGYHLAKDRSVAGSVACAATARRLASGRQERRAPRPITVWLCRLLSATPLPMSPGPVKVEPDLYVLLYALTLAVTTAVVRSHAGHRIEQTPAHRGVETERRVRRP